MNKNTITCSFTVDKDLYETYKSIVSAEGKYVKGDLVKHMVDVIKSEIPNAETLEAIKEVKKMKENSSLGKVYSNSDEMFADIL